MNLGSKDKIWGGGSKVIDEFIVMAFYMYREASFWPDFNKRGISIWTSFSEEFNDAEYDFKSNGPLRLEY